MGRRIQFNRTGIFAALYICCAAIAACAPTPLPPAPPPAEIWPTRAWTFSTPEAQGIDSNALARALEWIRAKQIPVHSLFIARDGHAVLDAYFFPFQDNETHGLASVTKSITSSLVGIAGGEGRLTDLNAPLATLLPYETEALDDPRKGAVTLANLLSMTSGIDCSTAPGENLLLEMEHSPDWVAFMLNRRIAYAPGSRFQYCGGAFHIVSAVLTRAVGRSAFDLARDDIFRPLGITTAAWPADPQGNSRGFADLELRPRDAAKLGYLWLHHGRWENRQVVPGNYLGEALSPHVSVQPGIAYGYGFWLYPAHRPYDFEANGRGGQRITVVPDENLVAVITSGGADANVVAPLLAAAVKANGPLPPDPAGDARLAATVAEVARPPAAAGTVSVPQWAWSVSGRTYVLPDNPLGLHSLQLTFAAGPEALLQLQFTGSTPEKHSIGLDGVPRLSAGGNSGHRVAVSGQWRPGGFLLDYNEIARIDDYRLYVTPAPGGLSVHLTERTGLVDIWLLAKPA
ncbi:MAG TPA: serine hydrolase [Rhizomicrobium sp.]|nr:serine hydrolase [Rhizomicrobium sp.]